MLGTSEYVILCRKESPFSIIDTEEGTNCFNVIREWTEMRPGFSFDKTQFTSGTPDS